jgi:hypothetical protein
LNNKAIGICFLIFASLFLIQCEDSPLADDILEEKKSVQINSGKFISPDEAKSLVKAEISRVEMVNSNESLSSVMKLGYNKITRFSKADFESISKDLSDEDFIWFRFGVIDNGSKIKSLGITAYGGSVMRDGNFDISSEPKYLVKINAVFLTYLV